MKHLVLCLLAITLCSAPFGAAQAASKPKPIKPTPPVYPEAEEKAGHGGRVLIKAEVLKDGTVASLAVHTSSGYPALDEAALAAARTWSFSPATDDSGAAVDGETVLQLKFDANPGNAFASTCADLNAEMSAARLKNPQATVADANSFNVISGVYFVMTTGKPMDQRLAVMKNLKPVYEAVAIECEKSPQESFETVLGQQLDLAKMPRPAR